jgi:ubiquinone/menaquinone biosynthesis C-methylase UbiE
MEMLRRQTKEGEHAFSIELKSKECIRRVAMSNEAEDGVLIEGFLGELKKVCFVEGVMLEMEGINGILRMDLKDEEIRKSLQRGREKMPQERCWLREDAEKYARTMKKVSKWVYAPFATKIAEKLEPSPRGLTVLDLAAGPGFLSIELCRLLPDAKIIAVDPSKDMLEIAKKNADEAGISGYKARQGVAEEIPLAPHSVDVVINQNSLHEWTNPNQGFSEIFRVLKPGGKLFLKDPNRNASKWKNRLFGLLVALLCGREVAKGRAKSYDVAFAFEEVSNLLKAAGFADIGGDGGGLELFVEATKPERR